MKKVNIPVLVLFSFLCFLLLMPAFLAAWAEDEGTLSKGIIWEGLARLFYALRFPTNVLLEPVIPNRLHDLLYLGFLINCLFYGFVAERLITYSRTKK